MKKILIVLLLFILSGCGDRGYSGLIECSPMIPNDFPDIRVTYKYRYDAGTGSLYYLLDIKNNSDMTLNNVRFKINHKWWASLKDILVDDGFFKKDQPFGKSTLLPHKEIRFALSPDNPNHNAFVGLLGEKMSDGVIMKELRLHSDQGVGTWRFSKP